MYFQEVHTKPQLQLGQDPPQKSLKTHNSPQKSVHFFSAKGKYLLEQN